MVTTKLTRPQQKSGKADHKQKHPQLTQNTDSQTTAQKAKQETGSKQKLQHTEKTLSQVQINSALEQPQGLRLHNIPRKRIPHIHTPDPERPPPNLRSTNRHGELVPMAPRSLVCRNFKKTHQPLVQTQIEYLPHLHQISSQHSSLDRKKTQPPQSLTIFNTPQTLHLLCTDSILRTSIK